MAKTNDSSSLWLLTDAFVAVAEKLEPLTTRQRCNEAAELLVERIDRSGDRRAIQYLSGGLSAVARKLDPPAAARLLAERISKTNDSNAQGSLAVGLKAVAERMEPQVAGG